MPPESKMAVYADRFALLMKNSIVNTSPRFREAAQARLTLWLDAEAKVTAVPPAVRGPAVDPSEGEFTYVQFNAADP